MTNLAAAEAAYDQAAEELRLARVLDELRSSSGLAFRSLAADDELGPYLVAVEGELVGDVRRHGPGALKCWRAHPLVGSARAPEDDEGRGPYGTLRAAVASFLAVARER
ncbi:hypothetical protein [Streptomyces sp. NPDC096153]|uniref:hypothetical protein n=1 Tax=Streptomyces sp. NPDC096153 TaxID=3155548 RepID=UPI00331FC1A3